MRSKKRSLFLIPVICWSLFQIGCAGVAQSNVANAGASSPGAQPSPGSPPPANPGNPSPGTQQQVEYLYLPSLADCAVPSYAIDPNSGLLTNLPGAPFPTGANSVEQALAHDPTERFYFTGNVPAYPHGEQTGDPTISALKRDSATGALVLQQKIPVVPDPVSLAVDASGRFLYTNGFGGGGNVFQIDQSSGALTAVPGSPFPALTGYFVVAHPTMPYLYSTDMFGLKIYAYHLDQNTGEPTPLPGSPFSMAAEFPYLAIDPAGEFLYVLNDAPGPNIYVFRIQSDGTLEKVAGSPITAGRGGGSLMATGDFLYVGTRDPTDNIYGFRLDRSTGQLAQVAHVGDGIPISMPDVVAIDNSGRFLYAKEATDIYLFTIDQNTGALTFKGSAKVSAP
jgi:6-phosphogluconolactonase